MNTLIFPKIVAPLKFYAVVPNADWVIRMINIGANTVQLRCKDLSGKALYDEITRCVKAIQGRKTQLFINDHWQAAIDAGAYGVHLGQEDLDTADLNAIHNAGLRLGISTHSDAELIRALAIKPSYVACGAIFPTTTKKMPTAPQGLERLRHYVKMAGKTPTVAIGGIDLSNAKDVLDCGVSSLAVVRAVTEAKNPEQVVKDFQKLWENNFQAA
ncbi:MAG: thiamine phosphate synthase [Neisseriaceae bacterium]|nr:thiamine phosphate synthase [Neisseriaceae bacterium]